ncbi:hypothetical protein HMPREF9103_00575 [Lentilactobacillus parafarraginis F0439]|uniref:Uncharacterized protein n=1 Tax=Lentilactobacillus parafarraginis F0439 TaxID=797515 RepID=G9ZLH7_9LACO|nr:hypothetical protein HMPREF9103_00575 [Lentilactobacillus parafarraginis F0439]
MIAGSLYILFQFTTLEQIREQLADGSSNVLQKIKNPLISEFNQKLRGSIFLN